MSGSWDADAYPPADFAGADDIIINLAKQREPVIEIDGGIERTPQSLIIASDRFIFHLSFIEAIKIYHSQGP